MLKMYVICLAFAGIVAFAAVKSPNPVPSPAAATSPIEVKAKKVKGDHDSKILQIQKTCDANKKACKKALKELRTTVTEPKVLKQIDEVLATLK